MTDWYQRMWGLENMRGFYGVPAKGTEWMPSFDQWHKTALGDFGQRGSMHAFGPQTIREQQIFGMGRGSVHAFSPQTLKQQSVFGLGAFNQAPGLGQVTIAPALVVGLGLIQLASIGISAYHGYKRNNSTGWAIWWGLMGGIFPIVTPAIAFAQGLGKRAK